MTIEISLNVKVNGMAKKIGMLLILGILLVTSALAQSNCYDYILSDASNYSFYLIIPVKSKGYSGDVAVENEYLHRYFYAHNRKDADADSKVFPAYPGYVAFAKRLLLRESSLKLEEDDFKKGRFESIEEVKAVNDAALQGRESFIDHYFKPAVKGYNVRARKSGISDKELLAIMKKLINWQILMERDDESGYLMMLRISDLNCKSERDYNLG